MLRIEGAGRQLRHDDGDIEGGCLLADAAPLGQGVPFEERVGLVADCMPDIIQVVRAWLSD